MKQIKKITYLLTIASITGILIFISCKKEYSCEGCAARPTQQNHPPVARAGIDQTIFLPTNATNLDGSGSTDPDSNIISYTWTKISGPSAFNIVNANATQTQVTAIIEGSYLFELKVTDSLGLSDRDTVQITVSNGPLTNHPPVANAGTDQTIVLPTNIANLSGSGSTDPDNNIVSYAWTKISGPVSFTIVNAYAVQTTVTGLDTGSYQFQLKVTDRDGLFSVDTIEVTINPSYATGNYPGAYISPFCSGYWVCGSNSQFTSMGYTVGGYSSGAYGATIVADNKIFFGGGHQEGYPYADLVSYVAAYIPATNSWQEFNSLSKERSHLAAIAVGNKVLFAGGNNNTSTNPIYPNNYWSYYNNVDIYDATSQVYYKAGSLSEARAYMAAVSCDNKAWFIGGKDNSRFSDRIDIYNPADNSWSQLTLPRARGYAGAVGTTGNKIFIAGGQNESGNLKTIDVYDVNTHQWTTLEAPHEHPFASVTLLNNKIFIAGGDGLSNKSVDIYNIQTNSWTTAQLSDSRFDMAVGVANNKIVYLSGNYSSYTDVYNDITGTWTPGSCTGATGTLVGSLNNKCYFNGFLIDNGNTMTGTMVIIEL